MARLNSKGAYLVPTINQLTATNTVTAGDLIAVWSQANGDTRKAAMSVILAYMQSAITFPSAGAPQFTTQYAAPSASGFTVTITNSSANTHLILTPTAGYAAGTIILPAIGVAADKQEILVNTTQQVTTLTINGNGAVAVTGEPSSLAADDFFRLRFDLMTQTWYRVG